MPVAIGLTGAFGGLLPGSPYYSGSPGSPNEGSGLGGILVHEIPIGTYNGVNTVFTLSRFPVPQIVWLMVNGVLQAEWTSRDGTSAAANYTLDGQTITFTVAPKATDQAEVWYFANLAGGGGRSGKARFFGTPTAESGGGSAGYASANGFFATSSASLTLSDAGFPYNMPTADDTLTIGTVTYTFVSSINNATPNQILTPYGGFGTFAGYLAQVINAGGDGVNSSSATLPNPDVTATAPPVLGQTEVDVTALPSPVDNPITLSASSSVMSWNVSSISTGDMSNGDTVTAGSKTYTFVTSLNNAVANQILASPPDLGAATPTLAQMLADAINGGAGAGMYYSSATTANTQVTATANGNEVTVTAKTGGVAGNSISVSSSSGRFEWTTPTLTGGTGGGSGASTDNILWGQGVSRFQITGDVSIAVWVKFPSTAAGTFIFEGDNADVDGGVAGNDLWGLSVAGSSGAWDIKVHHQYAGPTSEDHTFGASLSNDTWYFVLVVRNTTAKTYTLYIAEVGAGALTTIATVSYTNQPTSGTGAHTGVWVGASGTNLAAFPFTGTIEEHYVWNRQVTAAEGLAAMQGNPPFNGMVLGCYMGDTPEVDISGNGASGTVTGTTLVQGHS